MGNCNKKPLIIAEQANVMLWGFKITAKDRRDGTLIDGYAIETGNEDYEIEVAVESIKKKYAQLGYMVTECEYDETRAFAFNALEEFRKAKEAEKCRSCTYYHDGSVGQEAGCRVYEDMFDDNQIDVPDQEKVFNCGGVDCKYYEKNQPVKKHSQEDKPDFLAECIAALEELEEGGRLSGAKQVTG